MLELLLAASCLSTPEACPHMAKPYYASRPVYKAAIKRGKIKAESYVGRQTLAAVTVAYAAVTEKVFQVKIYKNINLHYTKEHNTLLIYAVRF